MLLAIGLRSFCYGGSSGSRRTVLTYGDIQKKDKRLHGSCEALCKALGVGRHLRASERCCSLGLYSTNSFIGPALPNISETVPRGHVHDGKVPCSEGFRHLALELYSITIYSHLSIYEHRFTIPTALKGLPGRLRRQAAIALNLGQDDVLDIQNPEIQSSLLAIAKLERLVLTIELCPFLQIVITFVRA